MPRPTTTTSLVAFALAAAIAGNASLAQAADIGPRLGLTGEPDQIHLGLHVHASQMTPRASFVPSFELGFGNDVTLFAGNMDFRYRFPVRGSSWHPYIGGGPALYFLNTDRDDSSEVGVNFVAGMQTTRRARSFFGELRLGLIDSPDFKFTVGWLFR